MQVDSIGQRKREHISELKYQAKRDGISIEEATTRSHNYQYRRNIMRSANAAYLEFMGMPRREVAARLRERDVKAGLDPEVRKSDERKEYQIWRAREIQTNPLRVYLRRAKTRAKKLGLEFSITEKDLLVNGQLPKYCPVFGVELVYLVGNRKTHHNSASLDRIENSKGYIPGNVAIISFRANAMKRDGTVTEHEAIAAWMAAALASQVGSKLGDTKAQPRA